MKKPLLASLSVLALALICAVPAFTQEGGMVRVITFHVQLGHQQHFESLVPKLWEAFKKAGVPGPTFVGAGVSDPSAYTFVIPIAKFADIDAQEEGVGKAFGASPDVIGEMLGITTSIDEEVWVDRPDLGYTPGAPRLKEEEQGFLRIALVYPHPGQAQAYEQVLKDRIALRKKHGLTEGVAIAQMLIGADGPAYAIMTGAKDEADFYVQNAKDVQKMGAEWRASLEKSGPMLRRVEYSTSSMRPALTYQP